jgi:hypothetical protein
MKFIRRYIILLLLIDFSNSLSGQAINENQMGQVSFVSSQNVYVKFRTTAGISVGDTLFNRSNGSLLPALIVQNLSSTSCVCTPIGSAVFSVADVLTAKVKNVAKKSEDEPVKETVKPVQVPEVLKDTVGKISTPAQLKQIIRGSLSLNAYLDNSNTIAENSQRYRYTLSLDAANIANSRFSFETYVSFKYLAGGWQEVKNNIFNALKIYSLSARYDINATFNISLGRRINPVLTSIGAIDGIQFEKVFKKFSLGAVAGSRPDFATYGFNFKLFQYGAYVAYKTRNPNNFSESSLAFMQQTNNFKTDRRFIYFQHSNSVIKNTYFFGSLEADLYQLKTDTVNHTQTAQNSFSLTGLYLSLSYRAGRKLSFSGSYDARKNVMYYETYKTFLDRVLGNELRQGFRLQASYRITNAMTLGLQSGYRFLKSDAHPSKNFYGYFTYSQIAGTTMSATLSATLLQSGYINGQVYSFNLSDDLFKGKVQAGIGYRYVQNKLPETLVNLPQHIGEMSIWWQITKKMSFSVNYEGTFEKQDRYNRFYLQLRQRF